MARRQAGATPGNTPEELQETYEDDPNFVVSLARGLNVLLAFAGSRKHLSISDISRITGLSRGSVARLVNTLEKLGYVRSEGRSFQLLPKTLALGQAYLSSNSLATMAQETLDRIGNQVNESCSIAVLDEGYVTFVARSASRRMVSASLSVGSRIPAYCTSLGRCILAHLPADELERHLAGADLVAHTSRTVTDRAALDDVLEQVRTTGYSISDSEFEEGLTSIAVPIFGPGNKVEAALGVAAIRYPHEALVGTILPVLRGTARDLGAFLRF
ncbi:IclR family transcriptional regulator domain-containing protein [Niveispirillum cyanobacteriorum]|uniref:IclR family transcriptional regulator n=1 Tax=Niveispirillum cyanobacteriorum TaxID=1612173 RepID=A0A2K9NJ62_9PROT|nr:IclR family transcriptional regulator C-terminal domain-containing protein [Niveispirillum cyanobacteriorum]AUN33137.1 IclR family transcriptional regulator [Niveispirillum cyanobacteriorum]GGE51404.1 IclR family transcriptional regulator [Niveispirillum cyanobacteriorum]